jgi:hypothetical protein
MKRVTGIGGIFRKAKDAPALQAWYKRHLAIDVQEWGGTAFTWADSSRELRTAAAQLRGDVLLAYTLDTVFRTDTLRIGPLQAVSLGFFPNKKANVTATCAAVFIDVRTGHVYGVAEASATEEQRSNIWNTQSAIEEARVAAEREAFAGALAEVEKVWSTILAQHARGLR